MDEKNGGQQNIVKHELRKGVSLIVWILGLSLLISVISLVLYLRESDYSDERLLSLLSVLRYSSFFVCFFSIFLLAASIIRVFRRPSALPVLGIVLSIFTTLYGALIIILDAAIISFTGGSG
ncbi:MAG: hypothetical protein FWC03_04210 [Treponema sp.]|nr:hypothetical protein [Treponema sp.]